jgi:hypothetical protein
MVDACTKQKIRLKRFEHRFGPVDDAPSGVLEQYSVGFPERVAADHARSFLGDFDGDEVLGQVVAKGFQRWNELTLTQSVGLKYVEFAIAKGRLRGEQSIKQARQIAASRRRF